MKDIQQKQMSRERSYWCNGDCEWRGEDRAFPINRTYREVRFALGCHRKVESKYKHANCDVFCSVLLTNFSHPSSKHLKFLTLDWPMVNCGGHVAEECESCPMVWLINLDTLSIINS